MINILAMLSLCRRVCACAPRGLSSLSNHGSQWGEYCKLEDLSAYITAIGLPSCNWLPTRC